MANQVEDLELENDDLKRRVGSLEDEIEKLKDDLEGALATQ